MDAIDAVILGVVEGLTEFLPVSSTAHLMLASRLLGVGSLEFTKSFEIAIQLGAILAVLALYGRRFLSDSDTQKKVLTAFVPTAVFGYLFYYFFKTFLLENIAISLAALFVGGTAFILFEQLRKEKTEFTGGPIHSISYPQAFLIGCFQSIAMIPGVSRAGATIIGGLLLGIGRKQIVEFSFLLAVPTIVAAASFDLLKSSPEFSSRDIGLLATGGAVSFVVALAAMSFLIKFIQTHSFISFGIYRIVAAIVFWWILF